MKTSYFQKRNSGLLGGSRLIGAVLGCIILILLVLRLVWPTGLAALFSPFWAIGSYLSEVTHGATAAFRNAATLSANNEQLRAENDALINENRSLAERLTDIGVSATTSVPTDIRAGILARPPVAGYDTLVVLLPQMVAPGAIALAPGSVPIGTLSEANNGIGRVALYSSSGRETEAWLGESRVPITLVGRGAGAFTAEVPRDTQAVVGDAVYLPGPGALLAGAVERIDADPASPSSTLFIRPAVNIFSLPWIVVRPL